MEPVNGLTGEMYHSFVDYAIPGRGIPLRFARTYSSAAAATNGVLGFGWTMNWSAGLTFTPNATSPTQITATEENGATTVFNGSGVTWTRAVPRVSAALTKGTDGATAIYDLKRSDGTTLRFNATTGRLLKVIDRNAYVTTVGYDASSRVSVITEPGGRTLTLTYGTTGGATGKITQVADSAQFIDSGTTAGPRTVAFTYNAGGELISSRDVQGNFWRFAYEAGATHRLTLMWDPKQNTSATASIVGAEPVETHYDATGKVDWQDDQLNRRTTFTRTGDPFSLTGATVNVTDPKGNVRQDAFRFGQRVSTTAGFGTASAATTSFGYDETTGGLENIVDPLGHIVSMRYDADGNMTQRIDEIGRTSSWTYNAFDRVLTETDALAGVTTNTYDANGNLTKTSRLIDRCGCVYDNTYAETLLGYDPAKPGDVVSLTDPDGRVTTFINDPVSGQRTQAIDPAMNKTTWVFDNVGRLKSSTAPKGNVTGAPANSFKTTYTFNRHGDALTVTDPRAKVTTFTYDKNRNRLTAQDANTKTSTNTFDKADQLIQTVRPDTTILKYEYYADGSLWKYTDGANAVTEHFYDPLGRETQVKDPLLRSTTYVYDTASRMTSTTNAASQVTNYTYDDASQLTRVDYVGATTGITFATTSYDALGRRVLMNDDSGYPVRWAYDTLGRLYSSGRGGNPQDLVYYYYAGKTTRIAEMTFDGRRTAKRTYDAAGRWLKAIDSFDREVTFGWDANSNLSTITYPNGIISTYTLNDTDAITKVSHKKGAAVVAEFSYGRDNVNNITSQLSSDTVAFGADDTLLVDNNNRLVRQNSTTNNYTYDAADNPTRLAGSSNRTQGFDTANQVCWQAGASATGTCAAPPVGATTYGYDAKGNRTTASTGGTTTTFTYDRANRLLNKTGSPLTNRYRADGVRVGREDPAAGGQSLGFAYSENEALPMILRESRYGASAGNFEYLYGPGGILLETTFLNYGDGGPSYYLADQYGSSRVMTNGTGGVRGTRTYDPYGKQTIQTGTWNDTYGTPFATLGWSGEYLDNDTGFVYLRARHYDPQTAQFLQNDPVPGGSCNAHDYACSSPLIRSDPSGRSIRKDIGGKLLDSYRKGRLVVDEIVDCEELAELIGAMRWSLNDRRNDFTSNIHGWTAGDKEFKNHVRRFTDERALLEALLARYDELGCEEISANDFVRIEKILATDPTEILGHPGRPGQIGWGKAANVAQGVIRVGVLVSAGIGAMVLAG